MAYHPANANMPHRVSPQFRNESVDRFLATQQYCRAKRLLRNLDPARSGVAPPYTYYHQSGMNPSKHSVSGSEAALGYPGNTPYGKYFHLGRMQGGQAWSGEKSSDWSPEMRHDYRLDFDQNPRSWRGGEPYYRTRTQLRHWDENLGYYPTRTGRRMWSPTLSQELQRESVMADARGRQLYGADYRLQYPAGWGRGDYRGSSPQVLDELAKVEGQFAAYDYECQGYGDGQFVKINPSLGGCACYGQCPYTQPAYGI